MSDLFFWSGFLTALGYLLYVGGKAYFRWLMPIVAGWFDKAL